MKVLIIENEKPAADKLVRILKKLDPTIVIMDILATVEDSINYLQSNQPDLILMDIQLDDGLCFEIFETIQVDIPVIFTTAYDAFTLKAFKVNSIDYLLKPIEEDALNGALKKFNKLDIRKGAVLQQQLQSISPDVYRNRFLIKIGPNYKPVQVDDICCFYIRERTTFIRTFSDRDFIIDHSLDHTQQLLDPKQFFRINRTCLVSQKSVSEIAAYSASRLQIKLKCAKPIDDLVVSREKVSEFKKWMDR